MEATFESSIALARGAVGPIASHLPAFVTSLIEHGYSARCVRTKAWRAVDFDRWLAQEGIDLANLSEAHIDQYSRSSIRPRRGRRSSPWRNELIALGHLLRHARGQGVCADTSVVVVPADAVVTDFEEFLLHERGLAANTIDYYRMAARHFLVHRFGDQSVELGALAAADITSYVQHEARRLQPRTMKQVVTALRAFLRYAHHRGKIGESLIGGVPTVAVWATTPLFPRAISVELARLAIESCDQDTAVGRRDRAVLLLLSRLGLRSGEVVALLLDDIDWGTGRLRVRGKNRHECLLPLPDDVGKAIAAYLYHGRPVSTDRHLFLRARAPIRGLMQGSDGVGSIVRNALERTGEEAPRKGAHQFRHALAVRMLQGGASLPEIGELLRHRSPMSTAIYAKVDLFALRSLALPWPGAAS